MVVVAAAGALGADRFGAAALARSFASRCSAGRDWGVGTASVPTAAAPTAIAATASFAAAPPSTGAPPSVAAGSSDCRRLIAPAGTGKSSGRRARRRLMPAAKRRQSSHVRRWARTGRAPLSSSESVRWTVVQVTSRASRRSCSALRAEKTAWRAAPGVVSSAVATSP